MADFPTYTTFEMGSFSESFDPSVERTEMERGPAKQMKLNSRVMVKFQGVLLFRSKAEASAFETWYFDTIGRIGWFNMNHPRTGAAIVARFVGGDIGQLEPTSPNYATSKRPVQIEYLR